MLFVIFWTDKKKNTPRLFADKTYEKIISISQVFIKLKIRNRKNVDLVSRS